MTALALALADWAHSLEYAAAAAVLDGYPGFASFTDEAVRRPAARRLTGLVETKLDPGGTGLAPVPSNEPTGALGGCLSGPRRDTDPASWTWDNAAQVLEGLCAASTA